MSRFTQLALLASLVHLTSHQKYAPGCPPPIATFIDYKDYVVAPKLEDQEIVTVKVRENNYFGETKCSIPQELQDPAHTIYANFRVEQGPNINRIKYCTIYLTSANFRDSRVELNLLLITELIPGLAYCEGPISAKARIIVDFCNELECPGYFGQSNNIGNRIINEESTLSPVLNSNENPNISLAVLIGIVFVITVITLSLIIGLIYFWCPSVCQFCFDRRKNDDLGTTKILTVRDNFGKIIPNAKSVEIWKTKENKIKTYDVPQSDFKRSKKKGYNELVDEPEPEGYSNFNSREDTQLGHDTRDDPAPILFIKKSKSPRNSSRLTILEELNPRNLSPSRQRSNSTVFKVKKTSKVKIIDLDDIEQSSNIPFEVVRLKNDPDRQLNFSRHYVNVTSSKPSQIILDSEHNAWPSKDRYVDKKDYQDRYNNSWEKRHMTDVDHYQQDYRTGNRIRNRDMNKLSDVQILKVHDDDEIVLNDRGSYANDISYLKVQEADIHQQKHNEGELHAQDLQNTAGNRPSDDSGSKDESGKVSVLSIPEDPKEHQTEFRRALSSISVIIEGDPSDYEDENEEAQTDPVSDSNHDDEPDSREYKARNDSSNHLTELAYNIEEPEDPPEPLSKRIADSVGDFQDTNRTPSPASGLAGLTLTNARNKRIEKIRQLEQRQEQNLNSIQIALES